MILYFLWILISDAWLFWFCFIVHTVQVYNLKWHKVKNNNKKSRKFVSSSILQLQIHRVHRECKMYRICKVYNAVHYTSILF